MVGSVIHRGKLGMKFEVDVIGLGDAEIKFGWDIKAVWFCQIFNANRTN